MREFVEVSYKIVPRSSIKTRFIQRIKQIKIIVSN